MDILEEATPRAARLMLLAALILIGIAFVPVLAADLYFLAGRPLEPGFARIALIGGAAIALFAAARTDRRMTLPAALLALLLLLGSMTVAALAPDHSDDGRYHRDAIYALLHGWNIATGSYVDHHMPGGPVLDFIDAYGKASWVLAAVQMSAGLGWEAAKDASVLLPCAAFLAVAGTARRLGANLLTALVIGAAAAANPVVLQEFWLRMNDGQLTALVALFLAGMLLWIVRRDAPGLLLALPAMMLAMNFKLSGVPIFAVLCAGCVVADWWAHRPRAALGTAALLAAAGLAGMLVLGFSPYVRNTIEHGFPFYPISGTNWAAMMAGDWPRGFETMAAPRRWLTSFFSVTGYDPDFKFPLSLHRRELHNSGDVEVMVAGLGPFFAAAAMPAAALGASLVAGRSRPRRGDPAGVLLILGVGCALASILMPQSWYFRYVPHLWLAPILFAAAALARPGWRRTAGFAVLALLLANSAIVLGSALVEAELLGT